MCILSMTRHAPQYLPDLPAAEIHHGAAAVAADHRLQRQVADELDFELVLREHLQRPSVGPGRYCSPRHILFSTL
jgi:hypothetical protein